MDIYITLDQNLCYLSKEKTAKEKETETMLKQASEKTVAFLLIVIPLITLI